MGHHNHTQIPLIFQHGQEEEGEQAPERVFHLVLRLAVAARVQPERLDAGGEVLQGDEGDSDVSRGGRHCGARVRSMPQSESNPSISYEIIVDNCTPIIIINHL